MSQASELNPQDVARYLQQYPDFFNHHAELLENIVLPHPTSGNVVSLVARQLEIFRNKQLRLENQLNSLLEIARDNDAYAKRMHQLTLTLLESTTPEIAISNLYRILTDCFLNDFVSLKIIQEHKGCALDDFFISPDDENLCCLTVELTHKKPRCGRLNVAQNQLFFADFAPQVKSSAIIPILQPDLTALLVIGSRDESRFHYSLGNLFLTQLGEIVGIRLATLLKQ
jgi:uncharacterized protein YigA (DUF484 family)